jgi:maleate isomerase
MTPHATEVSVPLSDDGDMLRIGLVTLASDPSIETSFHHMLAGQTDLALFVNRIAFDGEISVDTLRGMEGDIRAAAQDILPGRPLDVVLYGCTSASAAIGDDRVRALLHAAKPDARAVATPVTGLLAACNRMNLRKLSVITPYTVPVSDMLGHYLTGLGLGITALHCMGLRDDWDNGRVSIDSLCALAERLDHRDADALFISCTALRSAEAAARIEDRIGLPVVTSNQAMLWHGLRSAGWTRPIHGFGQLLELGT